MKMEPVIKKVGRNGKVGFSVNPEYCKKYNRSISSVAAEHGNIERGKKTYEFVKEHYDTELKIRENVEKFNELGHPMSEATLRRYLKKMKDEKIPLRLPNVKQVVYVDDKLYGIFSKEEADKIPQW